MKRKMGEERKKVGGAYLIPLLLIVPVLLQVSGCVPSNFGGRGEAEKIGLDFTFGSKSPPSEIKIGRGFRVILNVENYGEATSGKFVLTDSLDDSSGGIFEAESEFSIESSTISEGRVIPKKMEIKFPKSGRYVYSGVPVGQKGGEIMAKVVYGYRSMISPTVCVRDPTVDDADLSSRCPVVEKPNLDVKAPLDVWIEKDLNAGEFGGDAELAVNIHLKQKVDGTLSRPGYFGIEGRNKVLLEQVSFGNYALSCDIENNVVEIKSGTEKIISCYGLVQLGTSEILKHPLTVSLVYDVEVKKVFPFKFAEVE